MYKISYYFYCKKYRKQFKCNQLNIVIPKEFFTHPMLSYDEYKKIISQQLKMNFSIVVAFSIEKMNHFIKP